MELRVFTLPTCSGCPGAKMIALEVAQKYGITDIFLLFLSIMAVVGAMSSSRTIYQACGLLISHI